MAKLDLPLMGECATWLSIVSQLFGNRMAQLLEPHGMTLGQFSILHHIVKPELKGGMRISDIASAVEVGQPAVTKAIAKFETLGLVELEPDLLDKRVKTVIAKPEATQLLNHIKVAIGPDLYQTFSSIDEEMITDFATSLKQLGSWLDENRLKG